MQAKNFDPIGRVLALIEQRESFSFVGPSKLNEL